MSRPAASDEPRVLAALCSYGYDEGSRGPFYGLRAHPLVAWPGVVFGASLAPANAHGLRAAEDLLYDGAGGGWVLGDRNYWSPELAWSLLKRACFCSRPTRTPGARCATGRAGWYTSVVAWRRS